MTQTRTIPQAVLMARLRAERAGRGTEQFPTRVRRIQHTLAVEPRHTCIDRETSMRKTFHAVRRGKEPRVAKEKVERHPMADSCFLLYPLEEHEFVGSGNDYLCKKCHRNRALHQSV